MNGAELLHDRQARDRLRSELDLNGFATVQSPALPPELFRALREDAAAQRASGWRQASRPSVTHQAWRAEPGAAGLGFLESPEVLGLLEDLVGEPVALSHAGTCYTYYDGPGGHMNIHLDRAIDCTYTLIVVLEAEWSETSQPGPGLSLEVWPLGPLPGADQPPAYRIDTRSNMLAVGRGSQVPHRRPTLGQGERVVALTACYAPALLRHTPARGQPHPQLGRDLTAQGNEHWNRGERAAALRCYSRALEADPGCDQAWSSLGFDYWHQHRFIEAQEAFTRATRYNGDNPAHWSNIGLCLRDQGAFEAAIRCFRVALALDPRYAPALNEWANVLQDQDRCEAALPLYAHALAIDAKRAVVHHNLGVAYLRLGWRHRAEQAFRAALSRDPDYHHSLEELALLRIADGDRDGGRMLLEQAASPRAQTILESL